jgi:hypothetical protein
MVVTALVPVATPPDSADLNLEWTMAALPAEGDTWAKLNGAMKQLTMNNEQRKVNNFRELTINNAPVLN